MQEGHREREGKREEERDRFAAPESDWQIENERKRKGGEIERLENRQTDKQTDKNRKSNIRAKILLIE